MERKLERFLIVFLLRNLPFVLRTRLIKTATFTTCTATINTGHYTPFSYWVCFVKAESSPAFRLFSVRSFTWLLWSNNDCTAFHFWWSIKTRVAELQVVSIQVWFRAGIFPKKTFWDPRFGVWVLLNVAVIYFM